MKSKPIREFFLTAEEAKQIVSYIQKHPHRDFYLEEVNDPSSAIDSKLYISVYGDGLSFRNLAQNSCERIEIKDKDAWMLC